MTKKDVYVVVDTPKKAKKLKNLLNMFKEPMFTIPNNERSSHNGIDYGWGYGFSNNQWQGFNTKSIAHNGKEFKKVSIKELRNILAKEYLRKVFDNSELWLAKYEYRVKPDVSIGDWMFNPNSKKITQVKKDNHGKSLIGSGWIKIQDTELVEKLNSL